MNQRLDLKCCQAQSPNFIRTMNTTKKFILLLVFIKFATAETNFNLCSRIDRLHDSYKHFKGTVCTVTKRMEYSKAVEYCANNELQLLNLSVADKGIKETFFAVHKLTFEVGVNFWCGNKLVTNESSCPVITSNNKSVYFEDKNCSDKFWFICHQLQSVAQRYNFNTCVSLEEIHVDGSFGKTLCLINKKQTLDGGRKACDAEKMKLMKIEDKALEKVFLAKVNDEIGNETLFWAENETQNSTCLASSLNQNSLQTLPSSCDNKLWTYCETQERRPVFETNVCNHKEVIYNSSSFSMAVCHTIFSKNYSESLKSCEANNMTLFTVENSMVSKAFTEYNKKIFSSRGYVWFKGYKKFDGKWYTDNNTELFSGVQTKIAATYGSCLSFTQSQFMGYNCSLKFWAFCGKKTINSNQTILCDRKTDLIYSQIYMKSVCEVNEPLTFDDAVLRCQENQMELFVIDSLEVQEEFFKFVKSENFWINGRRIDFGPWFSYGPKQMPIFPGLSWSPRRNNAKCLSITKPEKNFEVLTKSCDENLSFYCEFQN